MRAVPIFRPGRHISAAGASLEFTEADLAATVAAYNPELHEAPIVVGHPKDNGPAYGWVTGLAVADGELVRPTDDKKLMQARRAIEKAAGVLRQLDET